MLEIQKKELLKALKLLAAFNCKYKVITPEGEEFGMLEVKPEKAKRPSRHPHGAIRDYLKELVNLDLGLGEVQEIEIAYFYPEEIRGGICSWLQDNWGKGTYTTCVVEDRVQLMRTKIEIEE